MVIRSKWHVEYSCDQPRGYVLGTDPGPGTPMEPGDRVRVRVTGGPAPNVRCAPPSPTWQQVFDLVRFARGLASAPEFAHAISIAVGKGTGVELTPQMASDPDNWVICDKGECHSPLVALAEITTRPETILTVADHLPPACRMLGGEPTLELEHDSYVYAYQPIDGPETCPTPLLHLEMPAVAEQITSIRLGLRASDHLAEDPTTTTLSAERQASADAFVAWARGEGPAPEFADRVRLLNEGGPPFGAETWMDDPTYPSLYSMCSGLPPGDCAIDPIYAIEHHDGAIVPALGRTYCRQGTGDLPPYPRGCRIHRPDASHRP